MTTTMSPAEILNLPVEGESGADNLRGFLAAVLRETWENEKRVFGESDWRYEAYEALARAGLVEIKYDEHGYVDSLDRGTAQRLMEEVIASLGKTPQ